MEPRSDRELMVEMAGNIKMLAAEINHLAESITALEANRMAPIEKRVTEIEKWQNNVNGGWKVVIIIVTILTMLSLFIQIFKEFKPTPQKVSKIDGYPNNSYSHDYSNGFVFYSHNIDDKQL